MVSGKCRPLFVTVIALLVSATAACSCTTCSLEGFDFEHACGSPNGNIPVDCKCYSPDGTKYILMTLRGPELHDEQKEPVLLTPVVGESENDAKAFCFSPDSSKIAILYHYANHIHIAYLVNIDTLKSNNGFRFAGKDYYHEMGWHSDGTKIVLFLRHRGLCAILDIQAGKIMREGRVR